MRRSLVTLFTFMALAAWAGAQGPPPALPAAEQAKLFKRNRILLESMVNHGLDLADADNPLKRAKECRKTATTLAHYSGRAVEDQDPDRVAELAGLLGNVVREGLVPNLEEARGQMRAGDPRERELLDVRDQTVNEIDVFAAKIPTDGKIGDSQKVKDALAALQLLKTNLEKTR